MTEIAWCRWHGDRGPPAERPGVGKGGAAHTEAWLGEGAALSAQAPCCPPRPPHPLHSMDPNLGEAGLITSDTDLHSNRRPPNHRDVWLVPYQGKVNLQCVQCVHLLQFAQAVYAQGVGGGACQGPTIYTYTHYVDVVFLPLYSHPLHTIYILYTLFHSVYITLHTMCAVYAM